MLFFLSFHVYIYLLIPSKALRNDKLVRIVMPKFQESSVKKHYPSVKEHVLFSKYWCATPKTWTPTFTYFWNVTFIHMIPLLINCLLLIILDNEHSEHEEHPEVPGGTHQEEVTA